ncbi:MAG: amino acid ABC transporter permease [Candidatus Puniceispirillum sp.]
MTQPPIQTRRKLSIIDYICFGLVGAIIAYAVYRVSDVLVYNWNWSRVLNFVIYYDEESARYVPNLLLKGIATTLRLAFWATIVAAIIGLVMGFMRTSKNLAMRMVSRCYVELVRNIPPVVFIFIFYFFLSGQLMPLIGLDDIDKNGAFVSSDIFYTLFGDPKLFSNFVAGALCLALFEGAYITEIVRAGIQSVPKGQWEAARAVGLSPLDVLGNIIFPQAIRKILPPLAGQFITLIKDSAIVSLISIQELTFLATEVASSTTKVFETWIIVGAMYFALCYSFAALFAYLEKRALQARR